MPPPKAWQAFHHHAVDWHAYLHHIFRPAVVQPRLQAWTQMYALIKVDLSVEQKTDDNKKYNADDPIHVVLPVLVFPINDFAVFHLHHFITVPALDKIPVPIHLP